VILLDELSGRVHLATGESDTLFFNCACPLMFCGRHWIRFSTHWRELPMDELKSFLCEECGLSCDMLNTLEEAIEAMHSEFGKVPEERRMKLCDECYVAYRVKLHGKKEPVQ
jgi:hypothetical protein